MKFVITIYRDEDSMYIADCPSIPGCVSQGKTEQDDEDNIREAIKERLEVRAEKGMPLTVATRHVEVSQSQSRSGSEFPARGRRNPTQPE